MTDVKVTFEGKTYDGVKLLAALHKNTAPLGMGVIHDNARGGAPLTHEEAAHILAERKRLFPGEHPFKFDYVHGRPLKVRADVHGELTEHSRTLYDRDAGPGGLDRALAEAGVE